MRIGIDATVLSYNREGIGNYIEQLVKHIPGEKLHENEVVLFGHDEKVIENLSLDYKYIFVKLDRPTGFVSGIRVAKRIGQLAKKNKVDLLVSTHSHLLPIFFKPTIQVVHDISPASAPQYFGLKKSSIKWQAFYQAYKTGLKAATKIVTISQFTKDEILKHFNIPEDKVSVIGGSWGDWIDVDISEEFKKQTLKKYGVISNNYFVSISTLSPRKNIPVLLEGFAEFIKNPEFGGYKLLVIGKEGWDVKPIYDKHDELAQKYPELKLNEKIIFTGFIEDDEAKSLLANSKALIMPSLYEGLGMPPMEAVLMHKEIILSDIPVFKEYYKEIAHFFKVYDPQSLANAMKDLVVKNQKLNTESSRENLKKENNWDNVANKLIDVILNYA